MKKIIALFLAALMLFSLAACANGGESETTTAETKETANKENLKSFTVIVVHADGSEKEFTYESAEEFIGPALVEEGLIEVIDDNSMKVTVADGEELEEGTAWVAYEDERLVEQSLDCTRIVEGTVYKLVYTSFGY